MHLKHDVHKYRKLDCCVFLMIWLTDFNFIKKWTQKLHVMPGTADSIWSFPFWTRHCIAFVVLRTDTAGKESRVNIFFIFAEMKIICLVRKQCRNLWLYYQKHEMLTNILEKQSNICASPNTNMLSARNIQTSRLRWQQQFIQTQKEYVKQSLRRDVLWSSIIIIFIVHLLYSRDKSQYVIYNNGTLESKKLSWYSTG